MRDYDWINSAPQSLNAWRQEFGLLMQAAWKTIYTHHKKVVAVISLLVSLSVMVVCIELLSTYTQYAAVIDARLNEGSLHQRPGIYASPRRISAGKRVLQDDLIQHLLRAGYLQGKETGEFAVGNFTVSDGTVQVYTSEFARTGNSPAALQISFNKNEVSEIAEIGSGRKLDQVLLPAEMLTADFNNRKQTQSALRFDQLPQVLVNAVCAIEDRRFFFHHGLDFAAIIRAAFKNVRHGAIREGGSTITQQLVKNEFLTPEKTYRRKVTEAMMALALERRLTKEQILTLYCERVYLGHSGLTTVYGFRQAAQIFFGKELDCLTISEAAFLAGMVKAPNRYSPHAHLDEATRRRNIVLTAMEKAGFIDADTVTASKSEHLALLPPQKLDDSAAPYFIDYVQRQAAKLEVEEEDQSRLRVETTIDLDLQQAANQVVTNQLNRISKLVAKRNRNKSEQPEAALVAIDPQSGAILAMVGGRDYAASQLNRASDAMRQPGSIFKPIVYATALSRGISPATVFVNSPHEIEYGYKAVYRPQNFGRSYSNLPVTLRESLIRSLNVVAVDAAMQAGLGNVASMAELMGLPKPETYPSMALGAFEATPMDVTRAYTTFANKGMRVDPLAIHAVKQNGVDIVSGESSKAGVLSAATAYLVTDTLADVVNRGTASRIRQMGYRGPAAGKTGTSRDAWFVGYTPKLLVVVWVGYDDNTDLGLTGSEAAVPIWADFVNRALELRPDLAAKQFTRPAGLEVVEIDPETGALANEFCPHRQRMLMATYLSPGICFEHQAPVEIFDAGLLESESDDSDSLQFSFEQSPVRTDEETAPPPHSKELDAKTLESKLAKKFVLLPPR